MIVDTSVKEIAAWHRARANEYEILAKKHREMAGLLNYTEAKSAAVTESQSVAVGPVVTLEDFEKSLERKGGRVAHLAARFNTTERAIEALLKMPDCKFMVGERGFIYPKKTV